MPGRPQPAWSLRRTKPLWALWGHCSLLPRNSLQSSTTMSSSKGPCSRVTKLSTRATRRPGSAVSSLIVKHLHVKSLTIFKVRPTYLQPWHRARSPPTIAYWVASAVELSANTAPCTSLALPASNPKRFLATQPINQSIDVLVIDRMAFSTRKQHWHPSSKPRTGCRRCAALHEPSSYGSASCTSVRVQT